MNRYKGTVDIFFGIEHRMRKEEMDEQFNKDVKQGWMFAADAAMITDENASRKIASVRLMESSWQLIATWERPTAER